MQYHYFCKPEQTFCHKMKLIWHFAIKKSYVYIFQTWKVNLWIMNLSKAYSKAEIIFNPLICSKTVQWIHPAETEFCWFCGCIPSSDWRDGVFTLSTNHDMSTGQQLSNPQALVEISQQCNWQKWSNVYCLKQWSQKEEFLRTAKPPSLILRPKYVLPSQPQRIFIIFCVEETWPPLHQKGGWCL